MFNKLYSKIQSEVCYGLNFFEASKLYNILNEIKELNGDIVEVGVWKGASAKIICELKKNDKVLHLFDTFEGTVLEKSNVAYREDNYISNIDDVKNYLKEYFNVKFYKGVFPTETLKHIKNKKINYSLVHIDVDTGHTTWLAMEYFYNKLVHNGYMLIHDYGIINEVTIAVDEFVTDNKIKLDEVCASLAIIKKQ